MKNDEFEPTSTHANWRGKVRCLWCPQTGWPCDGPRCWTNSHGKFCKHRPPNRPHFVPPV